MPIYVHTPTITARIQAPAHQINRLVVQVEVVAAGLDFTHSEVHCRPVENLTVFTKGRF